MALTLRKRKHPLSDPWAQREHLEALGYDFEKQLGASGLSPLRARGIEILQLNLGRRCNQTCQHCHVDAGPDRPEMMGDEVLEACLRLLEEGKIPTLDITGGAPEMHPRFRELVTRASGMGTHVMHRCNLTAIMLPGYEDIPELLAHHRVEIIASLPYYLPRQTDAQRGAGVFELSLKGLRRLNELGYGDGKSGLVLNLVTNPVGAFLPAPQEGLQADWKRELSARYGVVFDELYTITNMPISRFLEWLEDSGNLQGYMDRLRGAFNPLAADGVMCRDLVSVSYDGDLYDCDFNQMLQMPLSTNGPATAPTNGPATAPTNGPATAPSDGPARAQIDESAARRINGSTMPRSDERGRRPSVLTDEPRALLDALAKRTIRTGPHCFGCTAGCGSSCGGATA